MSGALCGDVSTSGCTLYQFDMSMKTEGVVRPGELMFANHLQTYLQGKTKWMH